MRLNKYWHLVEKNTTNYRPIEIVRFFALCVYLSCVDYFTLSYTMPCFECAFFRFFFWGPNLKVFLIILSFIMKVHIDIPYETLLFDIKVNTY